MRGSRSGRQEHDGHERQPDQQLERGRALDQRQVANRNIPAPWPRAPSSAPGGSPRCPPASGRSRQRHHRHRQQPEAQRHAQPERAIPQQPGDHVQVRCAGEQRQGEDHQQEGGLREYRRRSCCGWRRCRQRPCRYPCRPAPSAQRETANSPASTIRSAAGAVAMPSVKLGTSRAAAPMAASETIGAVGEDPGRTLRHHGLLADEAPEVAPGLKNGCADASEQPRPGSIARIPPATGPRPPSTRRAAAMRRG